MTVREIIKAYLGEHGYDGLLASDRGCACELNDLFPCDGPHDACQAAYRGPDPSGEGDWRMYADKDAVTKALAAEAALETR